MLVKLTLVCLLAATSVLGSSIKGHRLEVKGSLRPPAERYQLKPVREERPLEQAPVRLETLPSKTHYEARVQLSRDELAKGQKLEEIRHEQKTEEPLRHEQKIEEPLRHEQKIEEPLRHEQKIEEPIRHEKTNYEQKPEELRHEQKLEETRHEKTNYEQKPEPIRHEKTNYEQKPEPIRHEKTSYEQKPEPIRHEKTNFEQKPEPIRHEKTNYEQKPEPIRHEKTNYEQKPEPIRHEKTNYEQKPEELRHEQKLEEAKTEDLRHEQKLEEPTRQEKINLEQKPLDNWRHEQKAEEATFHEQKQVEELSQQRELDYSAQVEVKEEYQQRRLEEPQLVQAPLPLPAAEIQQEVKGGAPLVAPPGQAEPYAFDYSIEGSSRRESSDTNGVVRGQYTLQGADGSSRVVDYVADQNGFRASVNTNEFGTDNRSPAGVAVRTSQPSAEDISLRLEGKTREFLNPTPIAQAPAVPEKPDNWQVKTIPAPLPINRKSAQLEATKEIKQEFEKKVEFVEPAVAVREETQEQAQKAPAQPAKNAEIRQLKSTETKLLRSGFESATAHRAYRAQPVQVRAEPYTAHVQHRPVVPTVARAPVPVVTRTQTVVHRYPPSPVHSSGNRRVVVQPVSVSTPDHHQLVHHRQQPPVVPRARAVPVAAAASHYGTDEELSGFETSEQ